MKEFMLFIKATGNPVGDLSAEKQQEIIRVKKYLYLVTFSNCLNRVD
ncbi:MAG: hypothetical protein ACI9JN_002632 [Bacteroidia bacterium]|jgi:hypothetical protein